MNTARVADSYGDNPHEHKASQDPFDADGADEKQAETGGVECPGTSSSDSRSSGENSGMRNASSDSKPVRTTASHSSKDRTDDSTAASTASGRKTR